VRWLGWEIRGVSGQLSTFIEEHPVVPEVYDFWEAYEWGLDHADRLPDGLKMARTDVDDAAFFLAELADGGQGVLILTPGQEVELLG
jgi:hypothetical protein